MRVLTFVFSMLFITLPAFAAETYTKLAEIPIGGAGRFDYLVIDSAAHRLYVTHGTEIVVIDTTKNAILDRIEDTPGVHGIAIAPELGKGFISNGGEDKVGIIDLQSLQTLSKVETGANPDAILYIPTQKQVWVFNHTGESVTVIDAVSGKAIVTTALSGVAEAGQADIAIGRVFINIEDKDSVDVVDMTTFELVDNYPVAPASSPTGMAIDQASHHLFIGGGEALVMLDTSSGDIIDSAPICRGTDGTWFDAALSTAFVSCADGHITVISVSGDSLTVTDTINTARGARTMAVDPATHRLYTAAADYLPADPATPNARPTAKPDTFRVLVFGTDQ